MYTVSVEELANEFKLKSLVPSISLQDKMVKSLDINRPALQLTGYFDYFQEHRVQIIGMVEYSYMSELNEAVRKNVLQKLFSYNVPCVVLCRNLEPFPEMLQYAEERNIPLLATEDVTTEFMGEIIRWLKVQLAPRVTLHGVLIDIYGEGILIMGESGIGKSETALELVKRGHRLVADDAVLIKRVSKQTLIGMSPEIIRHFIELRGIGIIDISKMFGFESVKLTQSIDLVIQLESWDTEKMYDRLGLHEEYMEILGNKVVSHTIPIRPGRNLAVICESAAVNHRQKKMGYNAAQSLNDRVLKSLEKEEP